MNFALYKKEKRKTTQIRQLLTMRGHDSQDVSDESAAGHFCPHLRSPDHQPQDRRRDAGWHGVFGREISPDGTWAVFTSDLETTDMEELFSPPSYVGEVVKLNGALAASGRVWGLRNSPDSQQVVFRAENHADNTPELYSMPLDGSNLLKIKLGELVAGAAARSARVIAT
jgi:hypothetical protein